jgi:hypothetical protein
MTLEEFEREVIPALLAGDDPIFETLRAQYAAATVRDRENTGTGFFTYFDVPSSVPAIDRKSLHLDDLQVELTGAVTPAELLVHVRNGRLHSLEGFVYDGAFPQSPEIQAAWYYGTEKFPGITPELLAARDFEQLLEDKD